MATKKTAPAKKNITKIKPESTTKCKTASKSVAKTTASKAKKSSTKTIGKTAKTKAKPIKKTLTEKPNMRISAAKPAGPFGVKPYKTEKNEEYMSKAQLEHFHQILERWKQQLVGEMGRTVAHMRQDASNFPDPIDRASQEEEFSLELRTRDRERKLVRKIDEALERIADGEYGFCLDCGADIGVSRLEARPTATQCIECKTISEIKEKQTGTSGLEE